jgi:predicted negative regulator of RcsB-dependent stress response
MSNKIDRKELKEPDKFSKLSAMLFEMILKHRKKIIALAIAFVFLLLVSILYHEYSQKRENEASFALANAIESLKESDGKLNPDSEKLYLDVIDKYGNTFSAITAKIELADLYFKEKKYDKAYKLFGEVKKETGKNLLKSISLVNLAYIKEIQKDYSSALSFFEEVLKYEIKTFNIQAYFGMSRCFEKLHKFDDARSTYNKIITQFPDTEHSKKAEQFLPQLEKKGSL